MAKADTPMTESDLQAQVIALLREAGATVEPYHTHDSRKSPAGFPDVVAVVGGTVWFVECKTDCGVLSPEQIRWMTALLDCPGVRYSLVIPATLDAFERCLGVAGEPFRYQAPRAVDLAWGDGSVTRIGEAKPAADEAREALVHQTMHELGLPRERAEEIADHNLRRGGAR